MNTKKTTVSNKTLRVMFQALGVLGNRSMANTLADLKVGRLLNHLAPVCEPIIPARAKITSEAMDGADVDGLGLAGLEVLQATVTEAQAIFDADEIEVDMPTMRIEQDDLPKEKPGDEGWKNAAQLGAITSDLGVLFTFPAEVKK